MRDPLRFHREHGHLQSGAFGGDRFGQIAERFARFFGTPRFIIAQTVIVALWILGNAYLIPKIIHGHPFDAYPFILLNLLFSTQAAYAAPLILLAQTRQADRDKATSEADARHREEIADANAALLNENTAITKEVRQNTLLIDEVHRHVEALTRHFGIPAGTFPPGEVPQ